MKKKVLIFFGTRPESIKMSPVAIEMLQSEYFDVHIGLSGQHQHLVEPVLRFFGLKADFNLEVSGQCENIEDILAVGLQKLCQKIREQSYDWIFIHGDTSTTLLGSLAGFYTKTPVAHVEAGLRSNSIDNPFPEEMNRKITSGLAKFNFTATKTGSSNLLQEGVSEGSIFRTGNTVVDALRIGSTRLSQHPEELLKLKKRLSLLRKEKPWILLTIHRHENLNQALVETLKNTLNLARATDAVVLFPVHPNPVIHDLVSQVSLADESICLLSPLMYAEMIWLYQKVSLIITDSGGIQEEAASFGIPTLVTREITERRESIHTGAATLVGKDLSLIIKEGKTKIRTFRADNHFNGDSRLRRWLRRKKNSDDYGVAIEPRNL